MNPLDQGRIHVRSMYVTECKERRLFKSLFFFQISEYYRSNQEIIFINVLMNQCLLKLWIYTLVFFHILRYVYFMMCSN